MSRGFKSFQFVACGALRAAAVDVCSTDAFLVFASFFNLEGIRIVRVIEVSRR